MSIPKEARKVAHYWYGGGQELVVFFHKRHGFVRDGKTGEFPVCPERGVPYRYPGEGPFGDFSFETLGLYYGYEMPDTGWDGDC